MAIIGFLILGWILSWFDFQELFIQAFNELFNKDISTASYYLVFFSIGLIGDIVLLFKGFYF
ncbi:MULTISPECIES: hypothetical protein [Heyndrickxia]|uniref:hypothetical protein n=1 Tax=Heyndrickxia TaxID=2837504 RepID=UPI001C554912|nr:hypothetical protein [Heyndrickxia oleronia]MCI1615632.1 hypothetical protein [Heyndrickxia oleronia]MCI1746003.1 hypothetical protein [Heyndrickxia oleronia]MCI1763943.1 hypothetical protein [Heyndrickxia oleronia]